MLGLKNNRVFLTIILPSCVPYIFTGFVKAYPRELSASMLQRLSIARSFATQPDLLLMDEPYGQLDLNLKYKLEDELLNCGKKQKRR